MGWQIPITINEAACIYQSLVLSVLLYDVCAAESYCRHQTLVLDAFHVKCQRHMIRWHDYIRNTGVAARTGLHRLLDLIARRRNMLLARLSEDTPTHQALRRQINLSLSLGCPPTYVLGLRTVSLSVCLSGYPQLKIAWPRKPVFTILPVSCWRWQYSTCICYSVCPHDKTKTA